MTVVEFPQSRCRAGVNRIDITPPVGIYHRMWGAARHDQSTGVHRPLTATVVALNSLDSPQTAPALVCIAVDHCLFWHEEMQALLERIAVHAGIERDRVIVFFSHTHAAGLMGLERTDLPGGELIAGYLQQLGGALGSAVWNAVAEMAPCLISYGTGRCDLARNRDFFDPTAHRYVCGFNSEGPADDTVAVARITTEATGKTIATIVNYACHPTTLAWDNTLISPDYVGAMREIVERATAAPCCFLQGASGDLGPRDGFVGDTAIADRNGRQLGYAVLSALEALPSPATRMQYTGAVISGATIGTWRSVPVDTERKQALEVWKPHTEVIPLRFRHDLPNREELHHELERWRQTEAEARAAGNDASAAEARAMIERMTRRLTRVEHLPPGETFPYRLRMWRIGDAVWIALSGEHYHILQRRLRDHFPDAPLIIGTLANGSDVWYLPDADSYGKGLYQEDASILARGCLETLEAAALKGIESLLA